MSLAIGILSWGARRTLSNTLESYYQSKLLKLADQRLIYFQEISPEDIRMAKFYDFEHEGNSRNIGISGGYLNLLRRAEADNFLFLENDWECIEGPGEVANQMGLSQGLLNEGVIDLVRLRSRTRPGNPLWTRQFEGREYDRPTHLLDSVHWEERPERFKEITEFMPGVYFTSSQNANWTNNPHIAQTEFLRREVLPHMNPLNDIEKDIQSWWETQEFRVMQGQGLFRHNRMD